MPCRSDHPTQPFSEIRIDKSSTVVRLENSTRRSAPAAGVIVLLTALLAACGWLALTRPASPEQVLSDFFAAVNAGDRAAAATFIQPGELSAGEFLEAQFARAPFSGLTYSVSEPFGPGYPHVSVRGEAHGTEFTEEFRLARFRDDPELTIVLGTRPLPPPQ